jgi:hypothetical protein
MAWTTTDAILSYTCWLDGSNKCDGFIRLYIQYDLSTATPTSIKYRFKIDNINSSSSWTNDEYFIFWRPGEEDKEQFFRVKKGKTNWPGYSSTFTLTKSWDAANFKLPEFWLCHTGSICNGKTAFTSKDGYLYMTYGDAKTKKIHWYFTNNRQNFKTKKSSYTFPKIAQSVAKAVGTGTCTITDNGNNTFTLNGTKGANGTNNTATGPTLSWGYTNNYGNNFKNGDIKTLSIADPTADKRTVYAKSVTGATYGSSQTATDVEDIKQYVAPSAPGKPTISPYSKSKLTVKEHWLVDWREATATNNSSPVKGYRIRIYKKAEGETSFSTIPFYSKTSGQLLSSDSGSGVNRYYYDRTVYDGSGNKRDKPMPLYPDIQDIEPGDTIKIGIYSYSVDAQGNKYFNGGGGDAQVFSAEYVVQNNGILRVKVGGTYREGQVFVKVAGIWKEADIVHTKVAGAWKESQ